MLLRITKNLDKLHVISYQRDNGTVTWMKADDFFVSHDLSHYCIEKNLQYTNAFMGMLNSGMEIKDFEDRTKRNQLVLSKEALYAENMANLFLMEIAQGNFEDFNETIKDSFKTGDKEFSAPVLSNEQIISIRQSLRSLLKKWKELPAGETMQLEF